MSISSARNFEPTLILHGGAGAISHTSLPPALYAQYRASLLRYLSSTRALLESGASALDAAVHAVALMEEDELFNCGKGSVFTEKGTIEMEASVMVASVRGEENDVGKGGKPRYRKRGAGVMQLKRTRHPIKLAREVLLRTEDDEGEREREAAGSPHCQLSGEEVERMGESWGLETMEPGYFWTKKRWDEHKRGLEKKGGARVKMDHDDEDAMVDEKVTYSQGTVGAVCLDVHGDLAVATSTGGLTNKKVGRIGDTPTMGAGFWAEGWEEEVHAEEKLDKTMDRWQLQRLEELAYQRGLADAEARYQRMPTFEMTNTLRDCLPGLFQQKKDQLYTKASQLPQPMTSYDKKRLPTPHSKHVRRRAVAMSGTGNGDSFLRVNAVRTASAISRFSTPRFSLSDAVTAVAGPGGELQRSAGDRWLKTGEGQGGIIGIEVKEGEKAGRVISDFNCGGMFRAWLDAETGEEMMRVFRGNC